MTANASLEASRSTGSVASPSEDKALLLHLFSSMIRIRMVEEAIVERYPRQEMRCPVHLSIGQEAVPAAVSAALRNDDQIVSTHRCHAHYLAKGGDLNAMIAEIHGKASGCCGGRGGSMHLFDVDAGVLLSGPIVGGSIPVGVGAGLGFQQQKRDAVAVVYFGDASTEEGVFHESANFASVRGLPVVFVCENNLYSVYTHLRDRQPDRPFADVARAYRIPHQGVNGNDAVATYVAAREAVARARRGEGPSFISCDTYRWREHCGPNYDNDIGYRTEAEFQEWKARDPIVEMRRRLDALGSLGSAEELALRNAISGEIAEAFAFAQNSPFPAATTAGSGVYA